MLLGKICSRDNYTGTNALVEHLTLILRVIISSSLRGDFISTARVGFYRLFLELTVSWRVVTVHHEWKLLDQ